MKPRPHSEAPEWLNSLVEQVADKYESIFDGLPHAFQWLWDDRDGCVHLHVHPTLFQREDGTLLTWEDNRIDVHGLLQCFRSVKDSFLHFSGPCGTEIHVEGEDVTGNEVWLTFYEHPHKGQEPIGIWREGRVDLFS